MTDDLYTSFRKLSPKVTGGLVRMREDTFKDASKDASVPAKYKILASFVAVVVTKCEPCLRAYTKMAFQAGATLDELVEFLNVAITEGGCLGKTWALKAFETYKNLQTGQEVKEELCYKSEDN
ncbi:MAG: carboxymuconolactone decarboxylase family protein [Candidatus Aminicenantes bacterium]|nr:MAG: carboxymuconolactone decarboxylase family protein [Candidatus Aminicenantes bacterium]